MYKEINGKVQIMKFALAILLSSALMVLAILISLVAMLAAKIGGFVLLTVFAFFMLFLLCLIGLAADNK